MGFERCHPAVNLIFFAAVIAGMILFQHPVFLALGFLCACGYSIQRNRVKAAIFALCLIPCALAFALLLQQLPPFRCDGFGAELCGQQHDSGISGVRFRGWYFRCRCLYLDELCLFCFSTDKMVYLFGTLSPRLSLFLAILLRMVPRIKKEAKRINMAQKGIGRGVSQGKLWQRIKNAVRIFSILITWAIDSLITASDSMRSRGSSLRGRTAFSIYRFDNRDRLFVIALFTCLTMTLMAVILGMTDMTYDPRLIWKPINPLTILFYAGYTVLCLMPLGLELWTEHQFKKARENI